MYKTIIVLSLFLSPSILFASPLWEDVNTPPHASTKQLKSSLSSPSSSYTARRLLLNEQALRQQLFATSLDSVNKVTLSPDNKPVKRIPNQDKIFDLPLPDGSMLTVIATEYSMMDASLANRFPQFKTWKIRAVNGKNIRGRIDFTTVGFHAMLTLENGDTVFIDPNKSDNKSITTTPTKAEQGKRAYNSFSKQKNKHLFQRKDPIEEIIIQPSENKAVISPEPQARAAKSLITYRLALAATAEYSALQGTTKEQSFSAMLTTISRVNDIYERDMSIRLQLTDTDKLIYLNPNTDPYTNGDPYKMMDENMANIDRVIGSANYDVGHLFGGDGTGGLALLSSVCHDSIGAHKAAGVTGSASPYGDTFDIDYVAHEIGHQFGATHTFNSIKESCSGNNREASSAVEPGSGSTIMSYAGICAEDNLQNSSDAVFHAVSIEQINHYTRHSGEANCGLRTEITNNDPTLSTTQRHYIPINTPFLLTATGQDSDIGTVGKHDILTYTWDQIDTEGTVVQIGIDAGDNPLFRSYMPTLSNQRYFPQLATLFGGFPVDGETLSLTHRELNFATSVRDGEGGIARTDTKIYTSGNKAFKVTSQSDAYLYHVDDEIDVRWNEAGTSWSPINCNFVDIKLLTKDGATQDLLQTTQNDGAQTITIPENISPVSNARIMVACSDNIFFALSKGSIAIDNSSKEENQLPVASVNSPTLVEGDSGSKTLHYIISLTTASNQDASINYMINNAKNNSQIQTGIVHIPQGQTSAIISQIIEGNVIAEENKEYDLTLFSPQYIQFSSIGNLTAKGTVIDNDNQEGEITADKDMSIEDSAGGSIDLILTFFLIYISLLRLRLRLLQENKQTNKSASF